MIRSRHRKPRSFKKCGRKSLRRAIRCKKLNTRRAVRRKKSSLRRDLPPRACYRYVRDARGRRKVAKGKRAAEALRKDGWIMATQQKMRVSCLGKIHKFRWTTDTRGRMWAKLKPQRTSLASALGLG